MDLSRRLNSTIYVASPTASPGHFAKPTYGAPRPVKARIEPSTQKVVGLDKTETYAKHFLMTVDAITENDLVWLPGKDTTKPEQAQRPLGPVAGIPDIAGAIHHYETYLG